MLEEHRQLRLDRGTPIIHREHLPVLWPHPLPGSARAAMQSIICSRYTRRVSALAFAAHAGILACDHPLAGYVQRAVVRTGNNFFTGTLVFEVAAAMWAFSPQRFFAQADQRRAGPWDLLAALACLAAAALDQWPPPPLLWLAPGAAGLDTQAAAEEASRVARLLRCARLLGLPGAARAVYGGMATALAQLRGAAPAIAPILALRAIVLYILGVLAVQVRPPKSARALVCANAFV
jgi:hypothetical protein